jgi:hypothetical protein
MDESREEHVGGIQGVGVIQGNRPAMFHHETLPYYFEITIIDDFDDGDGVAIGFTNENFKKDRLPGWDLNTYGYHSDNGKLYHNSGNIAYSDKMKQFGKNFDTTTFSKGDVVGVGINYLKRNVYFVKNKKLLGRIYYNLEKTLYPTIGFWGKSVTVDVNFPTKSDLDVNHDMQYSNPQPPKRWWLWWK